MKKIVFIIFGILLAINVNAQIKEKWVDTDSLNAVKAEIDTGNVETLSIGGSERVDSATTVQDAGIDVNSVTYNDTLRFNNVNWIINIDSSYATNKNYDWLYNLGGN